MQKFFNITVGLAIIALAILLFLLWRSVNKKLEVMAALITPPPAPTGSTANQRTDISAGEFFEELRNSAENMTIEMKF